MINPSVTEIQDYLMTMLKWFHSFCIKNGLRYFAICGTMLGAARHNGFIPWDDDLDIGMPRDDYNRLYKLMKEFPDERYYLETPESGAEDFKYCFSKLYDTHTTLIENTRCKICRGIYIDIFPLDGMGNTEIESRKYFRRIDRKFKIILAHTTGVRKGRSFFKNAVVIVSQTVFNSFINDKKKIIELNSLLSRKGFDEYAYIGNPFGGWRYKEVMEREFFGTPTLYKFSDFEIYGVEQADKYLSHIYGDWRQLPPISKRKTHHDFLHVDLSVPYREYYRNLGRKG